ncbi:MarR family transcriptional regulator (plasmid) [Rhizobium sp. NIBRBAC000502774]|nr:MarR family transcriptional regulator [Rhizobium sp. NIBRBAC000502774]
MLDAKNSTLYQEAVRRKRTDLPEIRLCASVLTLAGAIAADCARRLAQHHLSEGKFVMLIVLHESKIGLPPNELATRCGVTRATVTGLIDGLERDGLARRVADQKDRRSLQVQLTEKGQDLARIVFDEHAEWLSTVFCRLDRHQSDLLASLVQTLWQNTDTGRQAARTSESEQNQIISGIVS